MRVTKGRPIPASQNDFAFELCPVLRALLPVGVQENQTGKHDVWGRHLKE